MDTEQLKRIADAMEEILKVFRDENWLPVEHV